MFKQGGTLALQFQPKLTKVKIFLKGEVINPLSNIESGATSSAPVLGNTPCSSKEFGLAPKPTPSACRMGVNSQTQNLPLALKFPACNCLGFI